MGKSRSIDMVVKLTLGQTHPWVVPLGMSHLILLNPLNFLKSLGTFK
jgi:hypothetical protein